jgi:hypothetical protein
MLVRQLALSLVALSALNAASAAAESARSFTGPQSSQTPYVTPTAPGWEVISLLTVGDSAKETAYVMAGIPDGLGALPGLFDPMSGQYVADKAYMTVFMNHEIRPGVGIVRAHGHNGAYVSQWTIQLNTLQVKHGEDLVRRLFTWVNGEYVDATSTAAAQFNRFCSADLPGRNAFYNRATGKGFDGLIYMNGEEAGNEGRAFAHVVSGSDKGKSFELPFLGKLSYENVVAHPDAGDKTIIVGLDDSTPGQVYVYVGDKRAFGHPIERAGLVGGKLYGVKVLDLPVENSGAVNGKFVLEDVSDLALGSGAVLQTHSTVRLVTEFARPEDGAWDTKNRLAFFFVTTGANVGGAVQSARLYKLTFDSLENPTGGNIELIVDSASLTGIDGDRARSFDNLTVDAGGNVLVQEDPGNTPYIAKVWKIDPAKKPGDDGFATQIFESDRARFAVPNPAPFNADEENSGIIEVTDMVSAANWFDPSKRYYLGDMQAHYSNGQALVEGGQLYLMSGPKR